MEKTNLEVHPCYSNKAHHKYYRLHLPVAPACNLSCNYCEKNIGGMSYHSYRPAVAQEILDPVQALERVTFHLNNTEQLKVVGIAGPGEPLANEPTFTTLQLVRSRYPDMILCLSTNGILIDQYINQLEELNVQSVSITINSFNTETLGIIYQSVINSSGTRLAGDACSYYIKEKQMKALSCLSKSGIDFKVNTILIPGINDKQIGQISKTIAGYHARLHNIVPFIPLGKLKAIGAPEYKDLLAAQKTSERYIKQFRLCKQCPSDAFDIPGLVKKSCINE